MHLAIEAVGAKHSGGAMVLADLLAALPRCAAIDRVTLFCSPGASRQFVLPNVPHLDEVPMREVDRHYPLRLHWYLHGLRRASRRVGADLVLCMSGMGGSGEIPHATFIQQSLPFWPEALERESPQRRFRIWTIKQLMRPSCRTSRAVFVQTPTMARWVAAHFGVPADRVHVHYPEPRALPEPREPSAQLEPMRRVAAADRLLYVGNTSPYKNVEVAVRAMDAIRKGYPSATLFLTWPADHPACDGQRVIGLGYLHGAALTEAYRLAGALIQPSLVEAGPLTMLEAMSVGTPVLVADRPYAHDICQDAATFFDPLRPEALAEAVNQLRSSDERRRELVARGSALVAQRRSARTYESMLQTLATLGPRSVQRAGVAS